MELYYSAVKMYNIAVFSFEVRSYISDLGLATMMDEIERNETNKAKYSLAAERVLVDKLVEKIESYKRSLSELNVSIKQIEDLLNTETCDVILDCNSLKSSNSEKDQIETLDLSELTTKLSDKTVEIMSDLRLQIKEIKKKRRQRYWIPASLVFVVVGLGCTGLYYWKSDFIIPGNPFVVSIVASIVAVLITGFISWLFDKSKKAMDKTYEKTTSEIKKENSEIIANYQKRLKGQLAEMQDDITGKMQEYWESDIMVRIKSVRKEALCASEDSISNLKRELRHLIVCYKNLYSDLHNGMIAHFNDIEGNISDIEQIASEIKKESIEPSFQLLTKTLNEMSSIKKEIESIQI
jgi:vacuolar-type H+-ATPase subunit I/STV1